jgi:general stress protein CsbA
VISNYQFWYPLNNWAITVVGLNFENFLYLLGYMHDYLNILFVCRWLWRKLEEVTLLRSKWLSFVILFVLVIFKARKDYVTWFFYVVLDAFVKILEGCIVCYINCGVQLDEIWLFSHPNNITLQNKLRWKFRVLLLGLVSLNHNSF